MVRGTSGSDSVCGRMVRAVDMVLTPPILPCCIHCAFNFRPSQSSRPKAYRDAKKKAGTQVSALKIQVAGLEAEAESEFTRQRARNVRAGRIDKPGRSTKVILARCRIKSGYVRVYVVSIVGAIGQVECLCHDQHVGLLTDFEVLAQARIKLKEAVSTQRVERHKVASSGKVAGSSSRSRYIGIRGAVGHYDSAIVLT